WEVDNTDPASVSKAMMEGRRIARDFRDALAEFHPEAYANAFLVATGSLMGSRESRRVTGDYVLTADDYFARRSFEDEICRNCYFVDIHTSKEEIASTDGTADHVLNRYEHLKPGESHGVPYRCLTPKGLTNVLVAGRSISCDRAVQASVRVMPPCLSTGEAAGVAAYLAAQADSCDVHAVDTDDLRTRLRGHGVYLP
ncbi:MAG: FAD-dependent oxidoreductase, partial [bacterium]|nr:FAD-dependent oxidoreductase [bacterium]